MNKEFWDVLDFKGRPTGQTVCRRLKGKFPKGRFHLVVHIWVTNSRGEFLIQQRSPFKQPMAGEWAATEEPWLPASSRSRAQDESFLRNSE